MTLTVQLYNLKYYPLVHHFLFCNIRVALIVVSEKTWYVHTNIDDANSLLAIERSIG